MSKETRIPSGESIWQKVKSNPRFNERPQSERDADEPLIKQLPEILADKLDNIVTAESFFEIHSLRMEAFMDKGLVESIAERMTPKEFKEKEMSKEDYIDKGHYALEYMIEKYFEKSIGALVDKKIRDRDLKKAVKKLALSESEEYIKRYVEEQKEYFLEKEGRELMHLNDESFQLFKNGELTFAKLLEIQPERLI